MHEAQPLAEAGPLSCPNPVPGPRTAGQLPPDGAAVSVASQPAPAPGSPGPVADLRDSSHTPPRPPDEDTLLKLSSCTRAPEQSVPVANGPIAAPGSSGQADLGKLVKLLGSLKPAPNASIGSTGADGPGCATSAAQTGLPQDISQSATKPTDVMAMLQRICSVIKPKPTPMPTAAKSEPAVADARIQAVPLSQPVPAALSAAPLHQALEVAALGQTAGPWDAALGACAGACSILSSTTDPAIAADHGASAVAPAPIVMPAAVTLSHAPRSAGQHMAEIEAARKEAMAELRRFLDEGGGIASSEHAGVL